MAKPLLASQTVVASLFATGLGVLSFFTNPTNLGKASDCAQIFEQDQIADNLRKYGALASSLLPIIAIVGRVKAGGVYTPKGVFGPNKEDIQKVESMPARINQIAFQLAKVDSTVSALSSLVPKNKPIDYSPDKMHDTVKDLLKQQIGKNLTEGVALPPIDMGQTRKTSLAELAAIAQEKI
jgi:hypothetical protein